MVDDHGANEKSSVFLEVTEVKGKLVAVATGPDGTKIESGDFKYEEGGVQFSIRRQVGIVAMTMSHEGKLEKGRITGKVKVSGPINQIMDWDAKRVEEKRR